MNEDDTRQKKLAYHKEYYKKLVNGTLERKPKLTEEEKKIRRKECRRKCYLKSKEKKM